MYQELRAAAHDLMNLVARLTFLAESLGRQIPAEPARSEAAELLADTMDRLKEIAERLRSLSGTDGVADA